MRIIWYDTVDSTNAEVLRRAAELEHLSVIAAREQTAGRGQRGNKWTSAPGENLTFTVLVKHNGLHGTFGDAAYMPFSMPAGATELPVSGLLVRLNMAAAVAVRNFLRAEGVDAVIKWPNDIYVGKKKICGMLIENKLVAEGAVSAVGIGLNLNQTEFPPSLLNPTSLKLLTGRDTDPEMALERFMTDFSTLLRSARNDNAGMASIHSVIPNEAKESIATNQPHHGNDLCDDYCSALFQKDVVCPYRDLRTGEIFTGIIRGVSPADGRLMVERSDGGVPVCGTPPAKKAENDGGVPYTGTPPAPGIALYGFKEIGYIL